MRRFSTKDSRILTLYSSPSCTLGHPVQRVLHQVALERGNLRLQLVDIMKDREAFRKFKHDIPVVFLDDREIARHRLERDELEKILDDDQQ